MYSSLPGKVLCEQEDAFLASKQEVCYLAEKKTTDLIKAVFGCVKAFPERKMYSGVWLRTEFVLQK